MIENYFRKAEKRKTQDEEKHEELPRKLSKKESCIEGMKLDIDNNKLSIPNDVCSILKHLPELKWKTIKAENLHLSYAIMFTPNEARTIFNHLEKEVVYDKNLKIQVFGKWHGIPRKQASYGDHGLKYTFSGTTISAREWTPFLRQLRDALVAITGNTFNFVLINRYKDGSDHIGEHKDDERELVQKSPIASLSFGEARDFVFRHQDVRGSKACRLIEPVRLQLRSGSILLMRYPTNSFWYHSLPVRKKCLGPRINLTFRHMHF